MIGQGIQSYDGPLFRNLRKHGAYFKRVKPDRGVELLLAAVEARAKSQPCPLWTLVCRWSTLPPITARSSDLRCRFQGLEPVRAALLKNI